MDIRSMDKLQPTKESRRGMARDRLIALSLAFAATLVAAPGHAVNFPNIPLQSGTAYPAANVRFILDDSGSMNFVAMPADIKDDNDSSNYGSGVQDGLDEDVGDMSYVHNTIYYNPATTYLAWLRFDSSDKSSRYTGGTSYTQAYWHPSLLSNTVNLSDSTQTFFVPKSEPTTSTSNADYYRYQLRTVSGKTRVVRSEWLKATSSNQGLNNAGCNATNGTTTWRNCTIATPTGREEADELVNFATWYSYHRSRMKVAKAGASEAFGQLKDDLRIGFDSINRNSNGFAVPYNIPVNSGDGRFKGGNRSDWYDVLHAAKGSGSTPLHRALQRAGNYFSSTAADGPWGPEAKQISCRQNFAILTTDGYWNDTDGYTNVGDADGLAGDKDGNGITSAKGKSWKYEVKKPYYDNFVETGTKSRADTLADVAMYYWKNDLRATLENDVPESFDDPAFWQHMVTFGVSIGLKGKLDPKNDLLSLTNGTKHWGDPTQGGADADRIDDLWHASVNSRGDFLVASNTKEFVRGLLDAFTTVAQRVGSASNVTANSTSFVNDVYVYQASYTSGRWSGELKAFATTAAGVSKTPAWSASGLIPTTGRTVLTWSGSGGTTFPTTAQRSALDASSRLVGPATGDENAAYIKGTRAKERQNGGELRDRDTLLGDIVNSSPMYVKETQTIYVGANDGMLHAISTADGKEVFAYVPGGINLADLKTISDPQYSHRYFVDGPIVVSNRNQTAGRNYLVGALGRGGKGVYGLDVTTPGAFKNADVLWELSTGSNLGNVVGEPIVARLNNGTDVVIFGNGYNSTSGLAVLYVVNIRTGAIEHEIATSVGSDNGLAAPRGWDDDGNGTVDYVYAGDLKGNVWKFDLSVSGQAKVAFNGNPLFSAGANQPITGGLALARDPQTGKRWVFAGTGRFMELTDLKDVNEQAVYGLVDEGSALAKSQLQSRGIHATGSINGQAVRSFEEYSPLADGKKGWYVTLNTPMPGERVTSRPQVRGTVLVFASLIPPTEATCDAPGKGYVNALDVFTGTGVPQDGYFNKGKVGGNPVGSVDLGVGMPTLPIVIDNLLVVGGSTGGVGQTPVNPQGGAPKRVSWREILRD
jgi:type IV pilus assembly protein PilY1